MAKPLAPRCWFLNSAGTELIQVQTDRFIHNWRKVGDGDQYPRYEHLRTAFAAELRKLVEFLQRQQPGRLVPNQCEVTYVNHIVPGDAWKKHGDLDKVLTVFQGRYSSDFLGDVEEAGVNVQFVIPGSSGKPMVGCT